MQYFFLLLSAIRLVSANVFTLYDVMKFGSLEFKLEDVGGYLGQVKRWVMNWALDSLWQVKFVVQLYCLVWLIVKKLSINFD